MTRSALILGAAGLLAAGGLALSAVPAAAQPYSWGAGYAAPGYVTTVPTIVAPAPVYVAPPAVTYYAAPAVTVPAPVYDYAAPSYAETVTYGSAYPW